MLLFPKLANIVQALNRAPAIATRKEHLRQEKEREKDAVFHLPLIDCPFNQNLDFISYFFSILLGCSFGFNQSEKVFSWNSMRKLCPNYDREYALDTVLEVPIPEEMFTKMGNSSASRWQNMRALMRAQAAADKSTHLQSKSDNEFIALLKLVGSPLIPFQVHPDQPLTRPLKDCTIVCMNLSFSSSSFSLFSFLVKSEHGNERVRCKTHCWTKYTSCNLRDYLKILLCYNGERALWY